MTDSETVFVSVLLPVYNAAKYIADALDSILSQTFDNFELIVIDDGSSDKSLNILREYESKDTRIRLFTRENRGLIASLNEGIDIARGKWLVRMDADDIALPTRIERQLYWADKTGADIVGSWVKFFGSFDRRIWKGYQSDEAIKIDMLFKCPFVHPSVMMRRDMVKQLKYDPISEKAEDYDLWVRAALAGCKMFNVPEVLLKYRKHTAQVSVVSADMQQSMTEVIRKKYWEHYFASTDSISTTLEAGFNVSSLSPKLFDLEVANNFFVQLASRIHQKAKEALLDNIYRLSLRNPNVGKSWVSLNKKYNSKKEFWKNLSILFLQHMPSKYTYGIHYFLKTLYLNLPKK